MYAIDTPPPTVSGSLHVGHVFSTRTPTSIARYQRMRGKAVFYPMGWDNGLPTERACRTTTASAAIRRCRRPVVQGARHAAEAARRDLRPNFVELCAMLTTEDERRSSTSGAISGSSVDWAMTCATIGRPARRVSQMAFLRSLRRNEASQLEAPTLWDVDFRTAVAQAELEDREMPGAYHRVRFAARDSGTGAGYSRDRHDASRADSGLRGPGRASRRPALSAAVRPRGDDPAFGVPVPIKAHPLADPEKGTGLAMICTFGDVTDVTWWRELSLPVRAVLQANGTFKPVTWGAPGWASDAAAAQARYDSMAGLPAGKARARVVELLKESGDLIGDPRRSRIT